MAKQPTKADLLACIKRLEEQLEAEQYLRAETKVLWLEARDERDALLKAQRVAPARTYAMPAWQQQRATDMANARAIAMATGRAVKV